MRKRIVWKLAACFAMVLLLFSAVLGAVFSSLFRQHTISINRKVMEEKAISIAETLSSYETGSGGRGKGMGHGNGGYSSYLYFLDDLAMGEVWIVDKNMNLLTAGHGKCNTTYEDLPEHAEQIVQRVFQGEVTYGEEFSTVLDTPSLTVGAPILINNQTIGVVLLHSPVSGIRESVYQGLYALAAGAGAALLLAGGAAVLFSYYFTNPLRKMEATARKMADGFYDTETGVTQDDEIGQLANTIDLLAHRLSQGEQERAAMDQMKENFFANVSHELRTPVAVLKGSLEVLRDGTVDGPEEIKEYCQQMLTESGHLERLVNDLLDLSRLQNDQFELSISQINLQDVAWDTARAMRRVAQKKNVTVSLQSPEEECLAEADYGRIRQMLMILLDNAVKFSGENGEVILSLEVEQEDYKLSVINHGPEIPAEVLPHIFERFQKEQSAKNQIGTGLGLAIAQQIAQRHGAEIQVVSSGEETCFWVVLHSASLEA